jgi:gamma-glutamyl:cysteine ligase YbdK (ATP-grasp superfamily)
VAKLSFRYGIEHECALLRANGQFMDFANTSFEELQAIVDTLPFHLSDYPNLRIGDLGIKLKRWYVEGYERFDSQGQFLRCDPKGIEVRTSVHHDIGTAAAELQGSYGLLADHAQSFRFRPIQVSHNPFRDSYRLTPDLNAWERRFRGECPEDTTAHLHMTTYGTDLNISAPQLDTERAVELGTKLTFYSPYVIPFTFSSPFYLGQLWGGLSIRTHIRTGVRPAVRVFVSDAGQLLDSSPSLTKLARTEAEVGRIEFKACDACADLDIYAELLTLLKGLIIDNTLPGRRITPDPSLHKLSARHGFEHDEIRTGAQMVLRAAKSSLLEPEDQRRVTRLEERLESRECPARAMMRSGLSSLQSIADPLQSVGS